MLPMDLGFAEENTPYRHASQRARHWTESWVHQQVYCPNCGRENLQKYANNRPVADFHCETCAEEYELKSQKSKIGARIVDGAYKTMCERLESANNPNLMLLRYDRSHLSVSDLCIVPKQFFVHEIIQKRKPLAATARRAGWVGCNILLGEIPQSGRIFLVQNGHELAKDQVIEKWQQMLFLRDAGADARGWLIEVMKCVEAIGKRKFDLDDVYAFEQRLSHIYPNNRHVKPKIRQQLQVLRDNGFLEFAGRGSYRLKSQS